MYALEIEEYMQSFSEAAFRDSGVGERREVLLGSASESIGKLASRGVRFDIAFLDADKTGYLVRAPRVLRCAALGLKPWQMVFTPGFVGEFLLLLRP